MKVVFGDGRDSVFDAARRLAQESDDDCFSVGQLASTCKISLEEAREKIDVMEERDLCVQIDSESTESVRNNEKWCLRQPSLTVGSEYEVLAIFGDYYLILSDPSTEPYGNDPLIYHKACFDVTDSTHPMFWQHEIDEDGEDCYFPPGWGDYFFEDYHGGNEMVRKQFLDDLKKYHPETWKERRLGEKGE